MEELLIVSSTLYMRGLSQLTQSCLGVRRIMFSCSSYPNTFYLSSFLPGCHLFSQPLRCRFLITWLSSASTVFPIFCHLILSEPTPSFSLFLFLAVSFPVFISSFLLPFPSPSCGNTNTKYYGIFMRISWGGGLPLLPPRSHLAPHPNTIHITS